MSFCFQKPFSLVFLKKGRESFPKKKEVFFQKNVKPETQKTLLKNCLFFFFFFFKGSKLFVFFF